MTRLQMSLRPADRLASSNLSGRPSRTSMALSPDGRLVVFCATQGTVTQLYVRGLDRSEATPLQGTEGGIGPFFSPDGAWIGFWAGNAIKKVPVAGGSPATISSVPEGSSWGASWGDDGTIFFAGQAGIFKVSSAGGTAAAVTTSDASTRERHLLPYTLPGGRELLFTTVTSRDWDTANVVLLSLDSGERRVLIPGGADARYVSTGHIVFMKTGTLMAVPFDLRSRQVTGTPVTLVEGVMQGVNAPNSLFETGAGQFAVASGSLIYALGGISPNLESSWVWLDRTGATQEIAAVPAGPYLFPRLSPGGERVAVNVRRVASRSADVWVYDVLRGAPTRLTFEEFNSWPVWSPDGKRLVYGSKYGRDFQPLSDQRGWQRQTRAARDQRLRADSIVMVNDDEYDRVPAATSNRFLWDLGPSNGGRAQATFVPRISFQLDPSGVLTRRALDSVRLQRVREP